MALVALFATADSMATEPRSESFQRVIDTIQECSSANGIDATFLMAMAWEESRFDPGKLSPRGADGIMQLMPYMQKAYNVRRSFSMKESVQAGAKFFKHLLNRYARYRGGVRLAIAAYNAGEPRVDKYLASPTEYPLPAETTRHVEKVLYTVKQIKAGRPPF